MQTVMIGYENKQLAFLIRPEFLDRGKCIDLQVLKEAFGENTYRLTPDKFQNGSGIMIDVGANIGAVGIQAMVLGAKKVISIEPNRSNIETLRANFLENSYEANIVENALASEAGKSVMISDDAGNSKTGADGERVTTKTLTQILIEDCAGEPVDVLKVDIEGDEYEVLLGTSMEMLSRIRFITMEFHPTTLETFGRLIAHLSMGFCVETVGSYERGGQIVARRY